MTYTTRIATPNDVECLREIALRTFEDTYKHHSAEDQATYFAVAYTLEKIRSEIEDPNKYTILLFAEDNTAAPCGYAMLHDGSIRPGDSGPREDYLEIMRFYIDKPYHGKGAAYVLMDEVMKIIKTKNRVVSWLGVWEKNLRGQRFYAKFGFEETGAHIFSVGSIRDRDVVFTLTPI